MLSAEAFVIALLILRELLYICSLQLDKVVLSCQVMAFLTRALSLQVAFLGGGFA